MLYQAPAIKETSWLQEDRFENFRAAYGYASTQTHAIMAMSKLTPEEAYHLFEALKRGERLHAKE